MLDLLRNPWISRDIVGINPALRYPTAHSSPARFVGVFGSPLATAFT